MNQPAPPIPAAGMPVRIGRFEPIRCLGRGGQGIVYLARDPDLDREVAIKTLSRRSVSHAQLVNEARNVARLQHPQIVPLFEIGTHEDLPFLVYQYAQGESLKALISRNGHMPPARALQLIMPILDGLACAHQRGIIHRDITPANILVDQRNQPHILDFGLSAFAGLSSTSGDVIGTVGYMAPENLSNGAIGPAADLFSVSVILHEILTGAPLFTSANAMATMYKIVNEAVLPPSETDPEIDPRLDAIVMRGLEKDPSRRYADAREMRADLERLLTPEIAPRELSANNNSSSAVEFLMRRIRRRPDFPAFSQHMSEITQKTSNIEATHSSELSNLILKDYALTGKLLRLVNSAIYRTCGGGNITTVSRAVNVLGFERVRQAVLNITLFEHLKNAEQAEDMKSTLLSSFMGAVVARDLSARHRSMNSEEAFIVSLFLRLGKHLTIYYFPEEYQEIERQIANTGATETMVCKTVLGATYAELGMAIATDWKLPAMVVRGIRGTTTTSVTNDADRMLQYATFANELAEILSGTSAQVPANVDDLLVRYRRTLDIDDKSLKDLMAGSMETVKAYSDVLNLNVSKSALKKGCDVATGASHVMESTLPGLPESSPGQSIETGNGAGGARGPAAPLIDTSPDTMMQRRMLLINSISEIASTLMTDYDLNQVLVMILETLFRGIGFSRVLLVMKDMKSRQMAARFGFGEDIQTIMPRFRYPLSAEADIFSEAATTGRDFVVLDVDAEEYKARVPLWCRQLTNPRIVVLLPIMVNKTVLSIIYADSVNDQTRISVEEIKLFATLTKQAALAIKQKTARR